MNIPCKRKHPGYDLSGVPLRQQPKRRKRAFLADNRDSEDDCLIIGAPDSLKAEQHDEERDADVDSSEDECEIVGIATPMKHEQHEQDRERDNKAKPPAADI